VNSVCFSADGRLVLSGSSDCTMRLWDIASGQCLRVFVGHSGWVYSVCLSADRCWALSASADHTVRLWDVANGQCLHTFEEHKDVAHAVHLSADGCWAITGSWDHVVRLWELDWDLEAHEAADWEETALPELETFLTLNTPYSTTHIPDHHLSDEELCRILTRVGPPHWADQHVLRLIQQLQYAGFGWLRKDGVEAALKRLAASWQGPPLLPQDPGLQQSVLPAPRLLSAASPGSVSEVIWVGPPS
jgi:hypothetical protein